MTVGWTIFEIAVNFYQSVLCLFFLKSCVPIQRPSRIGDALCVAACTAFYTLYLFFDISITDSLSVLLFFIYLRFVSDERWYVIAFWVIVEDAISISIVGFMEQLCLALTAITHTVLQEPGPSRVVFVISTNLVLFLVFFIFTRRMRNSHSPLAGQALSYFVGTNIAVLFAIEMLFSVQVTQHGNADWHIFAVYGALLVCSLLSVFLYHLMTDTVRKENQAQLALNHAQLTKEYQKALKDMYTDMIARQHDFKHQLQTLEQLVQQGDSAEAKAFLSEYEKHLADSNTFTTGSIAVDALLTAKVLACKQNNIEFQLLDYPLGNLPISEVDFCAVVGNLLDNAIEGACRIADTHSQRWIHLGFFRIWDTFTIRCENSMAPKTVKRHKEGFFTAKESETGCHGFGIRNIELIAKAADGFCSFETVENTFIANITLPYPIREEPGTCSK